MPALLAVALLPAALVALPGEGPGAGASDGSSIQTIAVPSTATRTQVPGDDAGAVIAAALPATDTKPFSSLSASWEHGTRLDGVDVQVRTHAAGGDWTDWTDVDKSDSGPDAGSPDANAHARTGNDTSELVWVGASDGVQARVLLPAGIARAPKGLELNLINPGTGTPAPSGGDYTLAAVTKTIGPPQPAIRSRAAWGANESLAWKNAGCTSGPVVMKTAKVAFVHHSATGNNYSATDVPGILRSIYSNSVNNKGYCDFDYNFVVDKFGTIWEGRSGGIAKPIQSGATGGFNADTVSVMLLGNYQTAGAPAVMIRSLEQLLAWKLPLTNMNPKSTAVLTEKGSGTTSKYPDGTQVRFNVISGHRDAGYTSCPGDYVYNQLGAIRDAVAGIIGSSSVSMYDPAGYVSVTPSRVLDTRTSGAIGKGGHRDIKVLGAGGVPSSGVSAVALNVTGTKGTATTYLTVYPSDAARPNSSTVNIAKGQTQATMAVSAVSAGGYVRVYNAEGSQQVIVDILGYYPTSIPAGSTYHPVTPVRVFDSRHDAAGRLGAGSKRTLSFGAQGVPSNATGVVVNVTAVNPTQGGYIAVYPGAGSPPWSSSVNPWMSNVVANRVVVGLSGGKASVYNAAGRVDIVVDLVGWYGPSSVTDGSIFVPTSPYRMLDTRSGRGGYKGMVGTRSTISPIVRGTGPVPSDATAVALTLTATGSTAPSFVTASPGGVGRPLASDLNNVPSRTVANLVIVPIGSNGRINLYNDRGSVNLIADIVGFYVPPASATPASSDDSGAGDASGAGDGSDGSMVAVGDIEATLDDHGS